MCDWICENVDYVLGSTDESTSAADILVERRGVCRDFAHLGIALVRALGVPARYVATYAWRLDPQDFHAVFEAYLEGPDGGAWCVFDATRKSAADGIVRIGVGRDGGTRATPRSARRSGRWHSSRRGCGYADPRRGTRR